MKRLLEFVTFILYRYYNKGPTQSIAYESALMAMSAFIYINIATIIVALDIDYGKITPVVENYGRGIRFLSAFLLWGPFYIALRLIIKKSVIEKKKYSERMVKIGGYSVAVYLIGSMTLLILLII